MVVGDAQLARGERRAGLLAVGLGRHRSPEVIGRFNQPFEVALRHGEGHGDRVDHIDADDAGRVGRRDQIAWVDEAHARAAVHRRGDVAIVDVHPRGVDLALVEHDQALVLLHQRRLGVERLLGDGVLRLQRLVAHEVHLGRLEQGRVAREGALGLQERGLIGGRVDLGDDLASLHIAAFVEADAQQLAVDLGLDQHAAPGLGRADGADRDRHVPDLGCRRRHRRHRDMLVLARLLRARNSRHRECDRQSS